MDWTTDVTRFPAWWMWGKAAGTWSRSLTWSGAKRPLCFMPLWSADQGDIGLDITTNFVLSCFYVKNYKRGGDNVEHLTVFNQREFVLHAGSQRNTLSLFYLAHIVGQFTDRFTLRQGSARHYSHLPRIGVHVFYFSTSDFLLSFYWLYLNKALENFSSMSWR
jgi:hypothetical protein